MRAKMAHQVDIEARWQSLDPIFIVGRQRTGTSIMWRALRAINFQGFPEGHLWFDLVESLARFRDPAYRKTIRQDIFTLGSDRDLLLQKRFAVMMDQFHRDLLGPDMVRWVDKSPGVDAVRVAPMLAQLFPQSQFIFMLRNPITTVNSSVHYIPKNRPTPNEIVPAEEKPLHVYRTLCRHWVRVMETWRQVRHLLVGRYIEIPQEQIVINPDGVARSLAGFLGVPQSAEVIAHTFKSRRENTAFPTKEVGDFFYPVDWKEEHRAVLADVCADEMAAWGYALDFERPGGPTPVEVETPESAPSDMVEYYRWLGQQNELRCQRELAACQDLLFRINEGRVMRLMNGFNRLLHRAGLR